ncbi:MAG TPA: IPT/TIG domain-containing protein [Bryobacteraceae bacterium]|nr:IPT/TIG domain-containing protein [Bryobacteraceae bacterium]
MQPLAAQIVANVPATWGGSWNNQAGKTAASVEIVLDVFPGSNLNPACSVAVPSGGAPCVSILDQSFTSADVGHSITINSMNAQFQPVVQLVQASSFGFGSAGNGSDGSHFGSSTCCSSAIAGQITSIIITVDHVCFSSNQGCGSVFNNGTTPDNAILGHVTFVTNVPLAVVTGLSPSSASAGDPAFTLTVNGSNFMSGDVVLWNGSALTTTFVSSTQLTASVTAALIAAQGSATVAVQDPSSNKSNAQTFTINAPATLSLSSLSPSFAVAGGAAFTLTVNGSGFVNGSTVLWNSTSLTTTFVSATQLTASVSASLIATVANVSVTVQNPGGLMSNALAFAISAQTPGPSLASLSPSSTAAGGPAFTLTVNGSGFLNGAVVQWNSSSLATTFVSATQVTALVPASLIVSPATVSVTVVNPNLMGSNTLSFTITALSLPHFNFGNNFVMSFYVVNSSSQPASFTISFYDDTGKPVAIPFINLSTTSTFSDTIVGNGAKYYEAGTFQAASVSGSAVISAAPSITISATLRRLGSNGAYFEAAIPTVSGFNEFQIPFDATTFAPNGAQIFTGFAIANMDPVTSANVVCTARDPVGNVVPNAVSVPVLNPLGHFGGYLFPALMGLRGTLDCTSNTKIGAVALRTLGADSISEFPVIVIR